jgi:hypothetical protein
MKHSVQDVVVHGAIGGIVAGAVVAAWFLVVDLAAAEPFRTPRELAEVMLGGTAPVATTRLVLSYTALHFGVFAALGMGTALFLRAIDVAPGLLLGIPFGLGVLDGVHYTALLLTGAHVLTVLPATHVIGANVVAGLLLMGYLHYGLREDRPLGLATLKGYPLLIRGLVTGVVGGTALAIWMFVVDILAGAPFGTPAGLGSVLLLGADSPEQVRTTPGIVAAYTAVHFAAFTVIGFGFVALAEQLERRAAFWLLAVMGFIVLEAVALPTLGLATEWVLGGRAWWAVGVGNLVAVAAMGAWVARTHPALRRELAAAKPRPLV